MEEKTESIGNELKPATWVDRYGDYLFRYAVSRLRNSESSEEVVQETFLAALKHVEQYAGKGSERAWLLGILKRKIIDFIIERNRTSTLMESESNAPSQSLFDRKGSWQKGIESTAQQPLDSLEREEFWRILRGCLESLPLKQADVFVLREMDDRNTKEICKELKISASNLWVLLYPARLQLSNCMKTRWQQDIIS